MAALGPVEALPGESAAGRPQRLDVEAEAAEPSRASGGDVEFLILRRDDKALLLQRACRGDAQLAGEMIVAAAGEAQLARLRRPRLAPDRLGRPDRGEMLQRLCDMRASEPVIAMAAFGLDPEQSAVEQLGERKS